MTRLHNARSSTGSRYAAIDCAISAVHLIDWLLQAVTQKRHVELTGKNKNEHGAISGFIEKQAVKLHGLETCRLLANTIKHRVLNKGDDESFKTSHSIIFEPPFHADAPETWNGEISPRSFIVHIDGRNEDIHALLDQLEREWRVFLAGEGFLDAELSKQEIDYERFVE